MSTDINEQDNFLQNKNIQHETSSSKQQFKLPKLVTPPSRGRILSRKQNKQSIHLPSIKNQDQQSLNFRNTQFININNQQLQQQKDDFAIQVQQKLRIVLGSGEDKINQQKIESQQQNGNDIQDDFDFQQKINQNKQIIKMHRQKNQQKLKKVQLSRPNELIEKFNSKNKIKPIKPQSNYQKKMKDYNPSLQNKFLQRKKQSLGIIIEKQQKPMQRAKSKKILSMKDAIDQVKANFGYRQFKSNGQINNTQNTKDNPRHNNIASSQKSAKNSLKNPTKNIQKSVRKTQQNSPSKKIHITSSLFDNIQTFLQNPTAVQKHQKLYRQLSKKLQSKDMNKLEQQLKHINDKMGLNQNYQTKSTVGKQENQKPFMLTQSPLERTVRDWKRVEIKDKNNFNYHQSNFQKQLDYINYLQQKNSSSLSKFIDHQKIMVQLEMNRRFSKSIGKDIVPQQLSQ